MPKLSVKSGTTSKSVALFIQDSSSTTGGGLTGLVFNSAGLTAYWYQPGVTAPAAITLATLASTTSAYSSGGFKEMDSTNCPGHYRLDVPDAVLTGASTAVIVLRGATNMAQVQLEIELTAVDNQSATAFITGVNSLAPPTNWNLTSIDANGRLDVIKLAGTTQTARDIGASVLLSSGTGTGQIDFTAGIVNVNVATFSASAITSGAFASGAIHATAIASDALRNDAFANDCITAAKVAADVSAEVADAVWDEVLSGHATSGSTGAALSAAGSAGDPWSTSLPGAYGSGTAGKIIGDNINATISSRASQTSVDAVKAKTDNLPASPAATGDIPTALQNADALLNRDMSAVSDTNSRSPLNALRALRNKFTTATGTYTVFKEDDSTTAWTATLTTDAAADPITASDPT